MSTHPYRVFSIVPNPPSKVVYPVNIPQLIEANERHLANISERNKKLLPEAVYAAAKAKK